MTVRQKRQKRPNTCEKHAGRSTATGTYSHANQVWHASLDKSIGRIRAEPDLHYGQDELILLETTLECRVNNLQ